MQPADRSAADRAAADRAAQRQWRLAQVNVGIAASWLVVALVWWVADDATSQPRLFTVLGAGLFVAALSNLRQQQRNRRRRREREDPG